MDFFVIVCVQKQLEGYSSSEKSAEAFMSVEAFIFHISIMGHHCMKSVQIRSFFWSVFSHSWTEHGEILVFSPNAEKSPYLHTFHAVFNIRRENWRGSLSKKQIYEVWFSKHLWYFWVRDTLTVFLATTR